MAARGCAILCVDDEAFILTALKSELRMAFGQRFMYETAPGAEQALVLLKDLHDQGVRVILVISDWLMPGIKGDEFLATVRLRYPNTEAIMITGQADESTARRALATGTVSAVLRKPWKASDLATIVEASCREGQAPGPSAGA